MLCIIFPADDEDRSSSSPHSVLSLDVLAQVASDRLQTDKDDNLRSRMVVTKKKVGFFLGTAGLVLW